LPPLLLVTKLPPQVQSLSSAQDQQNKLWNFFKAEFARTGTER